MKDEVKKKPNWIKIRNEYETSNISQRKLAEKYKISFSTLQCRAKREAWLKSKNENHDKIMTKSRQKSIEKISDRNSRHISLVDKVLDACETILSEQLTKGIDMYGNTYDSDIINHSKIARIMETLEKAQISHRKSENIIDAIDKQKLDIEKEKLTIMQAKSGQADTTIEDDGFLDALKGRTKEVWADDSEED